MEYLIYDRIEEEFLVKLNTETPLNSKWGGLHIDLGIIGAEVFHWESGAKCAVVLLEKWYAIAAESEPKYRETDFVIVEAKPTTVHEFQDYQIRKQSLFG